MANIINAHLIKSVIKKAIINWIMYEYVPMGK